MSPKDSSRGARRSSGGVASQMAGVAASLASSQVFSGLGGADVEALASICSVRVLRKNEVLFREGDRAEGFYVIQSGLMSIYRVKPDGRAQIIHVFGPGESFAEATLATEEAYPACAAALRSSQVILVRREPLLELLARCPRLALRILASLSVHLRMLVQSIQDVRGRQIESRLASWILEEGGGERDAITLGVSKKVLAGQLGVTGETLSRAFARLRGAGAISVSGKRILVVGRERLVKLARRVA